MIDSLTVVFPSAVTLSSGVFELNETGVGDETISWSNPSGDGKTWVISLASCSDLTYGSLPNGTYTLTVHHADVSGITMSSDQTYNFWRLYGDYYGEGTVGADDDALLSADYGYTSSSSHYLWYMDVNDDGVINFPDLLALSKNYNHSYTVTTAGPIWIGASTTEGGGSGMILEGLSPRDFYYTSQWQVIQETANNPGTGGMQTADQYVWGIAYVNELVLRDYDSDGSSSTGSYGISGSGLDQRLYALQDANYNVTALVGLVSGSWTVVERFTYTPYGTQTVLNASGAQTTDSYKWTYGFQGGAVDAVTGLIIYQHRYYDPQTGTWTTQDPMGYVDGANLYQAFISNSVNHVDPYGLQSGEGGSDGGDGGQGDEPGDPGDSGEGWKNGGDGNSDDNSGDSPGSEEPGGIFDEDPDLSLGDELFQDDLAEKRGHS